MHKKTLAAAAMLAATQSQAQTQSAVTIYGIVDAVVQRGEGSVSSRWQLGSGGMATTRLGFRGVEDLGGGLHAGFNLEAQLAADTGSGTPSNSNNQASGVGTGTGLSFNRRSIVSVGGSWGQVLLGRDYTTVFWNLVMADPFTVNGVGTTQAFTSRITGTGLAAGALAGGANALSSRASNSVSYAYGFAPAAVTLNGTGGFYLHAMYFAGENPDSGSNRRDGTGGGLRVGYNGGDWNLALGYLRAEYLGPAAAPAPGAVAAGEVSIVSLLGVYDFKVVRLSALIERDRFGLRTADAFTLGATVPVGLGVVRVGFSGYKSDATGSPESRKLAMGYVYNLSQRTAVYATAARVNNRGGAAQALNGSATAANQVSTGYDLGLRHTF